MTGSYLPWMKYFSMIKLGWYSLPLPSLPSYEVSCWHCSPKLFSRNILIKARPGCCPGTESTCIWQTDIQEGRTCRASVLSRDTWYPLLDQLNGSLLWTPDPRPAEDHQDFISCFLVYLVLDSDLIPHIKLSPPGLSYRISKLAPLRQSS